jgi:hypothetical protein
MILLEKLRVIILFSLFWAFLLAVIEAMLVSIPAGQKP